jgi:hypothetical protein
MKKDRFVKMSTEKRVNLTFERDMAQLLGVKKNNRLKSIIRNNNNNNNDDNDDDCDDDLKTQRLAGISLQTTLSADELVRLERRHYRVNPIMLVVVSYRFLNLIVIVGSSCFKRKCSTQARQ